MLTTLKEVELQRLLHAQQKRTRFEKRRADELFIQLTEATRRILILRDDRADAAALLDMRERCATMAIGLETMVRISEGMATKQADAAACGRALLATAAAFHAEEVSA